MAIVAYSLFNGLVIQSYDEKFNLPLFVEIPKTDLSPQWNSTSGEHLTNTQDFTRLIEYSETSFPLKEDRKSIEEKLNGRELEKEFFRGLLEVVLYSFLFLTIIINSYDHSYIDLKIYSNSHLKDLITTNTSWKDVTELNLKCKSKVK